MKISFQERALSQKREKGTIFGILYGPGLKNIPLKVEAKEFEKVYQLAGESALISLDSFDNTKKYLVLINDIQTNPLSEEFIHIDFYQPDLKKKVEVSVPLHFEGIPPAVKELGGTLVKNFSELEIKAFPQKLPQAIKVLVDKLITFDDVITIKDLSIPEGVDILKQEDEIVALVVPVEDVEEEIGKPIEEDVESVTKVEKKEKDKIEEEEKE